MLSKGIAPTGIAAKPAVQKDSAGSKLLKKMGWTEGQGLGVQNQGITAPLIHKKIDATQGKIEIGKISVRIEIVGDDRIKVQKILPPSIGQSPPTPSEVESRIMLLKNMVDKGEVDEDLQEDVKEECETYGTVEEVKVVEVGDEVRVFVVFADVTASQKAKKIMHGRTFDQKRIDARYYDEDKYKKGVYDS
ncbi:RNA binding protein, putative [Perkinsus marinus ATCC 50983]|uniref:RNA binding protein, putative n=1 Tax=Perkinsus marinus (strain ATCC 50983 / TXsc) TaxID=423536 RepID=C5KJK1_PERM5|nr:RNA binding protein, putative [Perkinsus marinus ATCC 50983]EER15335.1 RNA binding protein, putative [Perkinsus marinus ATCC 50983]|eukprot:XP_002783539.1 RNA binding protein, putative [Perkinsus marinus ATCC 50983]